MVLLFAGLLLLFAGPATHASQTDVVRVVFAFPDGMTKSAELTEGEVRSLLHQNIGYMIDWWIRGALVKLDLPHRIATVDVKTKAKDVVAIAGFENGPSGSWVVYVNGWRSPYHINTQTRENVRDIRVAYESSRRPAG